MHIKRLPMGERAPEGWDYIRIERNPSGLFDVTGSIAHFGGATFSYAALQTREAAEAAGKAWAVEQRAAIVYLESFEA